MVFFHCSLFLPAPQDPQDFCSGLPFLIFQNFQAKKSSVIPIPVKRTITKIRRNRDIVVGTSLIMSRRIS